MEKINGQIIELNTNDEAVNKKNSVIASIGALIVAIIVFIALSIMRPFSTINILSGICLINMIFDVFFVEKLFGAKAKIGTDIYCVAFLMLTIPMQWFGTGGFKGIGALWVMFAMVYCIYTVDIKVQKILFIFYTFEILLTIVLTILFPQFSSNLTTLELYTSSIVSIFGILSYIQIVSMKQRRELIANREEIKMMQDEIIAGYQQSIAINDELVNTTSQLEMANKTQRSFNASMNHELRAPLNGIEGCLQILLMDDKIPEESKDTIRNALTASKTINQTVNDILDFAKLEEGKFDINEKAFDLRDILDNLATIFKPQASAKNLYFKVAIPKSTRVSLMGDSVRIQQVMTNLISNAVKYTDKGGVRFTISTTRGHLCFEVSDTGQGMSEESIKVLFDPFTRFNMEKNDHIQGTGLGMNIVSNMIKAMHGTIEVNSRLNEGTTFYVDIPIVFYDSSVTYDTKRVKAADENAAMDLSKVKVLCVDDTEINRTVFKGLLKKTNAQVEVADNGFRAIEMCKEEMFDIIFLDHMMPQMDGLETLAEIREINDGAFRDVPVVMFTGNAGEEYRKLYFDSGANGYLLKPIMLADLLKCFELIKK